MKGSILVLVFVAAFFSFGVAQEVEDIKSLREEQISKLGTGSIPRIEEVINEANSYLSLPIERQTIEELEKLAEKTNRASNFMDFILEEYRDYYSDNYRYEFVQEKVAPFHDQYLIISNKLRSFRNEAYFNIGTLYKEAGDYILAFFYFRDAFRLSSFTESEGDHKGMRYIAEIELKKLLGIEELGTFLYWKE